MRCAACGSDTPDGSRFCGSCGSPVATTCPHCGTNVPVGHRFCTACGSPLAHVDGRPPPAPIDRFEAATAERRRVSVLFLDLEGFTSLAEHLDPEEVRALQSRYFETARSVVARYGGTIEKFIGDAVMAIWGAPVAHEDDVDRAVRAALALVHAVDRLGGAAARHRLRGRAAVATGEAAVTLGAVGQGMVSGDLVNVASRLQGLAEPGSVLVDAPTRGLAPAAAGYERVGAVELKGRTQSVESFRASSLPTPIGARPAGHTGPFVGRDGELHELVELFDAVVRDGRCRVVTITGIAGIGKSRLAWELRETLDAREGLVAWHAGRAPAYGDEITFAAVAEMVRHRIRAAHDIDPEPARRRLASTLAELVRDDDERAWLEARLSTLLGHHGPTPFERDDLFAAWRTFFERVSATTPVVLVFEDLQWADAGLLDFIEHLGTWIRDHPVLIVAIARPELVDRRPTWGAAIARHTSMRLEPLPDDAMRELLDLRMPGIEERLVASILERAGGVPLYAVEVMQILADGAQPAPSPPPAEERRRSPRPRPRSLPRIDVPDSLRALISARIDALPPGERRLLLAASVLGRRFSPDALIALGADSATTPARVEQLVRRELLSDGSDAAVHGRRELAFVQDLVREVAYDTLSRSERRGLHLAAARWLESRTEEGAQDAESLAGHLVQAHDLDPHHPDARRIARRAVSALRRAASAALGMHVPEIAVGHLERALRLTDSDDQRAVVLGEAATAASGAGRLDLAEQHLREVVNLHSAAGRRRDALRARARLASVLLLAQRNEPAVAELESALRAIRHVARDPGGVELAAQLARARVLMGDDAAGLEWAERALTGARRHELSAVAPDLLVTRGTARFGLGDRAGGLDDLRTAIAEAQRIGSIGTELRARNNLAWLVVADDPRQTLITAREAVELASRMGVGELAAQLAEVACAAAVETGDWEWALGVADELAEASTPWANRINLAASTGIILALRGDPRPMRMMEAVEPLPADLDEQIAAGVDQGRAWSAFLAGDPATAAALARRSAQRALGAERLHALALATRAALWLGDAPAAAAALAEAEEMNVAGRAASALTATLRAGVAALSNPGASRSDYADAEAAWGDLDLPVHLALTLADRHRLVDDQRDAVLFATLDRLGANGLRTLVTSAASPQALSD